jgi:hypothetical protein
MAGGREPAHIESVVHFLLTSLAIHVCMQSRQSVAVHVRRMALRNRVIGRPLPSARRMTFIIQRGVNITMSEEHA